MARIKGIGAYPTDAYYDPDRPSWLPYWIDTFTESDRKYQADSILQATVNAAGQATGVVIGGAANAAGGALVNVATQASKNLSMTGLLTLAGLGALAFLYVKR